VISLINLPSGGGTTIINPTKVTLEQKMDEDQLLDIFGRFKQVAELYSDVESIEENFLPLQLLNLLNLTAQNEQSR
jgi:hypothetical protein